MVQVITLLLLLAGCFPASAAAAAATVLNNSSAEYLSVLGQKGTQIVVDIVQSQDALNRSTGNSADVSSNLLALEKLRNDIRLITREGDHLQLVITIARKMGDPTDKETVLLFVKVIAEEAARTVQSVRNDVNAIAEVSPDGTLLAARAKQVLSFMDEFANAVESIAREPK
jgi:hypothetical protein